MSSSSKPTKQCVQRLQREYKQIMKVVSERDERRRVRQAELLQEAADREQNPLFYKTAGPHPHQDDETPQNTNAAAPSHSGAAPSVSDELLFTAAPDPDNLLCWYFIFESPPSETVYTHGKYIGEFVFPADYPYKPPKIFILTPNGRFATGKEICLSNSSYHPESWTPAWSIETVLLGMISFFYSNEHTTGAIDHTGTKAQMIAEKQKRARESRQYNVEQLKQVYRRVLPDEYARDVAALEEEEENEKRHKLELQEKAQAALLEQQQRNSSGGSHAKDERGGDFNNNNTRGEDGNVAAGAGVEARRKRSSQWSALLLLMVAVLVTLRIVIF